MKNDPLGRYQPGDKIRCDCLDDHEGPHRLYGVTSWRDTPEVTEWRNLISGRNGIIGGLGW